MRGTRNWISVPAPGSERISALPPSSRTRPQIEWLAVTAGLLAAGAAVAAARRSAVSAVTATLVTVAAATGLAVAASLAGGLPTRQAGLAAPGVAALAQLAAARLAQVPSAGPADADPAGPAPAGPGPAGPGPAGPGPAGPAPAAGAPQPGEVPGVPAGVVAGRRPAGIRPKGRALSIRGRIGLAAEIAGWTAAAIGFGMTLTSVRAAPLGLLGVGTLLLVAAIHPARGALTVAGSVTCSVALVAWLSLPGRAAPEPYALPAAALVLAAGVLRIRRPQAIGSWAAYGPGLAIGLLPSLAAAWADHGLARIVLLCLAATGLALAGARARLQAPLVLGVTVAVLAAARELAPVAGRLNGWIYLAALGLLLLGAGATYEARLRDLRRLRTALRRLR